MHIPDPRTIRRILNSEVFWFTATTEWLCGFLVTKPRGKFNLELNGLDFDVNVCLNLTPTSYKPSPDTQYPPLKGGTRAVPLGLVWVVRDNALVQ